MLLPKPEDRVMTPGEIAVMCRVDPKTVARWAKAGKLKSFRTLGGHRRYLAGHVIEALEAIQEEDYKNTGVKPEVDARTFVLRYLRMNG